MSSTPSVARPLSIGGQYRDGEVLSPHEQTTALITLVATVGALLAVYWNQFVYTRGFWDEPSYSHGWIIPYIGIYLLWVQRRPRGGPISEAQEKVNLLAIGIPTAVGIGCYLVGDYLNLPIFFSIGWLAYGAALLIGVWRVFTYHEFEAVPLWERWVGAVIVIACIGTRVYATYTDVQPLDQISFIVALFGAFMLCGGLAIIKRMWMSLLFFIFIFPLPSAIGNHVLPWLQKLAAVAATFVLQAIGVTAHRQGNTIDIDGLSTTLNVAEACSGLSMVTIISAMSLAMVVVIDRPWWDKLTFMLLAVPNALAANLFRIVLIALLYIMADGTSYEKTVHEAHDGVGMAAAVLMFALGLIYLEYKILTSLTVEEGEETIQAGSLIGVAASRGPAKSKEVPVGRR
jgi:exosortase